VIGQQKQQAKSYFFWPITNYTLQNYDWTPSTLLSNKFVT